MNKAILTILIIAFSITAAYSQRFGIGGVHRAGTSPVMKQQVKEKLKSELNLTDDQANAVVVIQQDYELKARAVRIDTKTTKAQKKEKLQPLDEERREKLKKYLTDEQIEKLDEFSKDAQRSKARQA